MRSQQATHISFIFTATMFSLQSGTDGFVQLASKNRCGIIPSNSIVNLPFQRRSSNIQYVPMASAMNGGNDNENEPVGGSKRPKKVTSTSLPISSVILAFIALRSLVQLFLPTEIPGVFFAGADAPPIDYIATAFDVFFVGYGISTIINQSGVFGRNKQSPAIDTGGTLESSLVGLECRITLNIGREQGTWMDKEWAASGARLVLPINLRFSQEEIDLGFPGEEAIGGRYCNRLETPDGIVTFVGPQGEVEVRIDGGCWAVLPITERTPERGEAKLRFFLDFPDGASRNDVTLPAGRVFFSGVYFERATGATVEIGDSLVVGPNNIGILADGGVTVKKNGLTNLYGALGDTNLILGRYKVEKIY